MGGIVRLAKSRDALHVNIIANHPKVLPYVSDNARALDLTRAIPINKIFISTYGAVVFSPEGDSLWNCHIMFMPSGHGRHAIMAVKESVRKMFMNEGAESLVAFVPDDCPHSKPPRAMGFKQVGRVEDYIRGLGASKWTLSKELWRSKCQ